MLFFLEEKEEEEEDDSQSVANMQDELINLKKTIEIQALKINQKDDEIKNLKQDYEEQKQKKEKLTNLGYAELKNIIKIQADEIAQKNDQIEHFQEYTYKKIGTIFQKNKEIQELNDKIYGLTLELRMYDSKPGKFQGGFFNF